MTFETHNTPPTPKIPTAEDIQAALELIKEDPTLMAHPRVQALVETDFITADGRQLDPGNFLAAVKEALEKEVQTEQTEPYEVRVARIMDSLVVHGEGTGQ